MAYSLKVEVSRYLIDASACSATSKLFSTSVSIASIAPKESTFIPVKSPVKSTVPTSVSNCSQTASTASKSNEPSKTVMNQANLCSLRPSELQLQSNKAC